MTDIRYIYSSVFPSKSFKAIAIWKWVFIRSEYKGRLMPSDYTHEKIHIMQQKEITLLLFLIIYSIEFLVKLLCTFNHHKAYRSVSFEQEAYANETRQSYIVMRKRCAWKSYITKMRQYDRGREKTMA